ncbi:Nucleic-acid-binding protein from transposon X-element [Araneus ventricosus]|uniref:Nucleic-acid-binding protein from transposon X-element n=1 Tax=Araneus ventricosus TaxID=182803 RepID=A0A4Y2SSF3_ARAVE|nr:Nucleic-acid-binding protein from transposon X-element [Araneus ventricosus]
MGKFLSGNKLKVFPTTSDEHRKIQKLISDKQLKSFTFELPEQQQLKVVIRGLPPNEDIKDIELELIKHGLQPTNIAPMRHRMSGNSMHLYLVLLPKANHNVADIYKLDTIGSYKVSFEPLRRKGIPGQCFNCQEFWHSSRFCTRDAVCVKCAGPHESKSCTKPKDTPAKCGNCSGDHTANFSGCPQNPRNRVKKFPPAPVADDFPQLNTKASKNAVPAISVAWNNRDKLARVKAPPTAQFQTKRLVPRPHLLQDAASAKAASKPLPPTGENTQAPPLTTFSAVSLDATLNRISDMISNMSKMINSFMQQMTVMFTTFFASMQPKSPVPGASVQ